MNEREIFAAAIEMTEPRERVAWLAEICGKDQKLRRRVERLLGFHDPESDFLEHPPCELRGGSVRDADAASDDQRA